MPKLDLNETAQLVVARIKESCKNSTYTANLVNGVTTIKYKKIFLTPEYLNLEVRIDGDLSVSASVINSNRTPYFEGSLEDAIAWILRTRQQRKSGRNMRPDPLLLEVPKLRRCLKCDKEFVSIQRICGRCTGENLRAPRRVGPSGSGAHHHGKSGSE